MANWIGTSADEVADSLAPALDGPSDTGSTVVVTPASAFFARGLLVGLLRVRWGRFSSLELVYTIGRVPIASSRGSERGIPEALC